MSERKPNPLLRFMPSLTDVAFVMPIIFLFGRLDGAKSLLGDGDTGWHVRTGEWIIANGRVPDRDFFSFTKPGQPWFAWEWLWDLIFGWLHLHWGLPAVVLGSLLVICLSSALLYRLTRRSSGNPIIAITLTFLAMAASSIHWLARPHLFTILFVIIFYSILERVREGRTRLLWFLPPLMVLWTNLHGGFFVGIALIATYGVGELLAALFDSDTAERQAALRRSRPYWITAGICLLATLINPYTYNLHVHLISYFADPYHFNNIIEFFSLNFHHPIARYVEPLLMFGVIAAVWSMYRRRFVYSVLILSWSHLALASARNIPLFAVFAAPIIADMVRHILSAAPGARIARWAQVLNESFRGFCSDTAAMDRAARVPLAGAAVLATIGLLLFAPAASGKLRSEYKPEDYPTKALAALKVSVSDRIFTTDEWGDYLIYRLYPRLRVFIDGRSDFYGSKLGEEVIGIVQAKYDWERKLEDYRINTVLVPADAPVASALKESRGWRLVYDDGVALVFRTAAGTLSPARPNQQLSASTSGGASRDRAITNTNPGTLAVSDSYARR